jgi:hypothetical protein
MEITITDTAETAQTKLGFMNKRMLYVFRYISLFFGVFGPICLILGFSSGYTNHTSFDGHHTYSDYHLGTGIGIGFLLTAGYLELYLFKLRKSMRKFNYSITTYFFSDDGIKTTSDAAEISINWKAVQEIVPQKRGFLIATNNYSCPTMFFLNDQFSKAQLIWLKSKIIKK